MHKIKPQGPPSWLKGSFASHFALFEVVKFTNAVTCHLFFTRGEICAKKGFLPFFEKWVHAWELDRIVRASLGMIQTSNSHSSRIILIVTEKQNVQRQYAHSSFWIPIFGMRGELVAALAADVPVGKLMSQVGVLWNTAQLCLNTSVVTTL